MMSFPRRIWKAEAVRFRISDDKKNQGYPKERDSVDKRI